MLAARDDYEVLRLPVGAAAAALRKRYREMAVALHPDKCRVCSGVGARACMHASDVAEARVCEGVCMHTQVARATDAFQRLVQAYNSLLKVAA